MIFYILLQINLAEYYTAVSSENMIIMFASILFERRIIFTSKKLSRLSACVQAANAILYPMNWQHIFIPVLPKTLIDYLSAPMPYLIGLPLCLFQVILHIDYIVYLCNKNVFYFSEFSP